MKITEDSYTADNSLISTIAQHELLHTIGFMDLYSSVDSIMYYSLNPNIKTYTDLDREQFLKLESIITNQKNKTESVSYSIEIEYEM